MRKFIVVFLFTSWISSAQKLPVVDLENLDGETVSSTTFNSEKPVVITFWATWCVPCLNELSFVNEVYEEWQEKYQFDFYAISIDDDRTVRKVAPLVNGKNWPFKVLIDTNQDFKRMLNINAIPYLVIVKNGTIIYTKNGFVKGDEAKIEDVISKNQ
jgi:thiol-disulfide isomerase/thioredoxin